MKNLMILFSLIFVMVVYQSCGKKGNPHPPQQYGETAVQSKTTDDVCE